ncbi:MAG: hypothetical protein AAB730_01460 [Patescibacteria group bacterium]
MKNSLKAAIAGLALPMLALAATVDSLLVKVKGWLNTVIVIAFIILTLYFVWGVVGYVRSGGDEKKVVDAKRHMLWGIIGMAVAGAAWGIAAIIWSTLDVSPGGTPIVPQF